MARYYFDSRLDGVTVRDETGVDLADLQSARTEAARALGEMAKDLLPDTVFQTLQIIVRDRAGTSLLVNALTYHTQPIVLGGPGPAEQQAGP